MNSDVRQASGDGPAARGPGEGAVRAFIAVEVSDKVKAGLNAFQSVVRSRVPGARLVSTETMHLTLVFMGDTPREFLPQVEAAMDSVAAGFAPLRFEVRGVGAFGSARAPRVIWAGIADCGPLMDLQARLAAELRERGAKLESRPFSPHLTIARLKPGARADDVAGLTAAERDRSFGRVEARRLLLFESDLRPKGPVHSVLHESCLGKSA